MIIHKQNKGYEIRSDKPNENWLEKEKYYTVPDNSVLAKKIIANYPNINLVAENGRLIDVEVDETVKQEAQEFFKKEKELSAAESELESTNAAITECMEYFLDKITNATSITDLLKINDYPHDIKQIISKRAQLKDKINKLKNK